jgi:hypothetical protein
MKVFCLLLLPASLLAAILVLAVTLWAHGDFNVAHLNDEVVAPIGGLSAAEVRELIE